MKYKAVIFDLFGTLVENLPESEYRSMLVGVASLVLADKDRFISLWSGYSDELFTGNREVADCISIVCNKTGLALVDGRLADAYTIMTDPVRLKLEPPADTLALLSYLSTRNYRIGLISNCSKEVPVLWNDSLLAPLIEKPVFSCSVGLKKPDPHIYLLASEWLRVKPNECLFVDDNLGSLKGAATAGMLPVLKRTELDYVYDKNRPEVESWSGLAVDEISELIDIINGLG
jgi:putative hydrolase of the HAD superfamily